MATVTKLQRDQMSLDSFAFPRTRQAPMTDERLVILAWNMVPNVKDATDEERVEARRRIIAKAREFGVESKLKISAMSFALEAMSLAVPTTDEHPNKLEFSGVLTHVDQPSDLAPHGSFGKKVFLPKEVAEKALPTLLGMAVDHTTGMKGHDRKKKIGVITSATVDGSDVKISGFFYANDFPQEVSMIQANKEDLGFSFEAERILVSDLEQDPLRIESLVFTGAAVLLKKSAAYQTTSIAASAEEKAMEKEQFDALMGAIGALDKRVEKVEQTRVEAASVADKVANHSKKLHDVANEMAAAGIGCHQTRGHASILHHMADEMMAEAHRGHMPSEYRGMSMYGSAAGTDPALKAELDTLKADLKKATDELASNKTIIKDLQAAGQLSGRPDRKTLPPRLSSLLAKGNIQLAEGEKITITKLDAAFKGTSLSPQDRIEVKTALERAGLIEKAAA